MSAARAARAWQAAIAACSVYGPAGAGQRQRAVQRRQAVVINNRFHLERSWSSSRTGAPPGPTRAPMREAWIDNSDNNPCASTSRGASATSVRARRSASKQRSGRSQSSPAVAA